MLKWLLVSSLLAAPALAQEGLPLPAARGEQQEQLQELVLAEVGGTLQAAGAEVRVAMDGRSLPARGPMAAILRRFAGRSVHLEATPVARAGEVVGLRVDRLVVLRDEALRRAPHVADKGPLLAAGARVEALDAGTSLSSGPWVYVRDGEGREGFVTADALFARDVAVVARSIEQHDALRKPSAGIADAVGSTNVGDTAGAVGGRPMTFRATGELSASGERVFVGDDGERYVNVGGAFVRR